MAKPGGGGGASEDDFDVDLDELDELVEQMDHFNKFVDTSADQLISQMDKLHSIWDGQAAAAHTEWHDRWIAALEDMQDGLDKLKAGSRTAHGNYSKAVAANKKMWP